MGKQLYLALAIGSSATTGLLPSAHAFDAIQPSQTQKTVPFSQIENIATIDALAKQTALLIANDKIDPSQITVILDVDGTLTDHEDPTGYTESTKVHARGDAVEAVSWMIEQGIVVIFSSAWDNINETASRLKKLGLNDYLAPTSTVKLEKLPDGSKYDVMSSGRAISVRHILSGTYYRQKAYSAYFFNPELAVKTKVILFADDSQGNINQFKTDINQMFKKTYPSLEHVYLYTMADEMHQQNNWQQVLEEIKTMSSPPPNDLEPDEDEVTKAQIQQQMHVEDTWKKNSTEGMPQSLIASQ